MPALVNMKRIICVANINAYLKENEKSMFRKQIIVPILYYFLLNLKCNINIKRLITDLGN